jgi:hypothetical protein
MEPTSPVSSDTLYFRLSMALARAYAYVSPLTPFLLLAVGAIPWSVIVAVKVFEPVIKEV